jgi:putative aminopeptidase FrvX
VALNLDYLTGRLLDLLNIPSPTGFADAAVDWMAAEVSDLGLKPRFTRKGALLWTLEPQTPEPQTPEPKKKPRKPASEPAARALAAHVDTLGAMVREIKENGRLRLTQVGGYDWATVEGEYCTVHTASGKSITGTVVNTKQSAHVFSSELRDLKRDEKVLEVRLDAVTKSGREVKTILETRALGIEVGDFVSWQPRAELTKSGYLKSRHLDNKAACAILLTVTKAVLEDKLSVAAPIHFFISNFEEVGHGASAGIPSDIAELVTLDMAAIGKGQNSSEHHCSICLKDSSGPYDHELSSRLRLLASNAKLEFRPDTYPFYSSDGSAALRAGLEARVALIGPGVDASHSYERTHTDALLATARLVLEYITH